MASGCGPRTNTRWSMRIMCRWRRMNAQGASWFPVQDDLIQGGEEEAGVMVSTVQGGVESLKPMKM